MARCTGLSLLLFAERSIPLKTRDVTSLAFVFLLSVSCVGYTDSSPKSLSAHPSMEGENGSAPSFTGERFARTELFFGTAKPDGSEVSTEEFQQFVDDEITPRFPDGLTLLMGLGQFRGSSGEILQERSLLLILLYPVETGQDSSVKIEQIREAYKELFQQESVLRADRCCEKVGF
jgi:Protein of unknown function (DUF3574)